MRRLTHVFTTITLAAAFGAVLTGCPVWGDDDDDHDHRRPDAAVPVDNGPPPVTVCTSNANCPGGYCLNNRCATAQSCGAGSPCPSGYACDTRGLCVPGCGTNADCTAIAPGLVCDTTTRRCVPGGRCTTDAQCPSSAPVCLGGSCQARTNQCQFDYQCSGTGQACVDGRCVVGCTSAAQCAPGQQCTAGRCAYPTTGTCATPCATGQLCVNGVCLRTCANDAACGEGFMCDNGVCRVDTRPRPFCTTDSQCNAGSVCYNGACRRECPDPAVTPDGDCMRVDVQFNLCRPDGMGRSLCTSTNEVSPQCARTANCPAGRACVNARCQ